MHFAPRHQPILALRRNESLGPGPAEEAQCVQYSTVTFMSAEVNFSRIRLLRGTGATWTAPGSV